MHAFFYVYIVHKERVVKKEGTMAYKNEPIGNSQNLLSKEGLESVRANKKPFKCDTCDYL